MDFRFTPEEEAFRKEVREFLEKELPPDWMGTSPEEAAHSDEEWEFSRSMTRKLAAKGWLVMAWPKEYGGQGAPPLRHLIFNEEIFYHQAPGLDVLGVNYMGPALIIHGTEEQKKRHLGAIARGELAWCEGFSEPGAGSDLASLSTRAVEDGDYFIVNGQKVWTSNAHRADWCFLLARTDTEAPKHKGISVLLLDMRTPGITIRPLINIANFHSLNEVFFDNVRIPKENLVGEKNKGWQVAMSTLSFERSTVHRLSSARKHVERVIEYANETKRNGEPLSKDPLIRQKLAELAIEGEVGRMIAYRVAWLHTKGVVAEHEASMSRVFNNEFHQRAARVAMEILGLYGQLRRDSKWVKLAGRIEREYLTTICATIGAGTSQIQRNIIALRGLGLPRG